MNYAYMHPMGVSRAGRRAAEAVFRKSPNDFTREQYRRSLAAPMMTPARAERVPGNLDRRNRRRHYDVVYLER